MSEAIKKEGYVGGHRIIYFEHENESGEFSLINGEWTWIKKEV